MQDCPGSHKPILCAPLLRLVDSKLTELLRSLAPEEWGLETVVAAWRVRDVAAHLLDTALRKLSLVRDGWIAEQVEIRSAQELVELVNRLNREGVAVYGRLSPPILIEMMERACAESAAFHESLDPFAPAAFAVSWAGEQRSCNWFDTARELTERWHHQQQIRLAVSRPGIMTRELYYPVLDCFLRGLPYAFRRVEAPEGTAVQVEISGECGGAWLMARENQTRENETRENETREDETRENQTRENQTRENETRENQTRENQARENQARENEARENEGWTLCGEANSGETGRPAARVTIPQEIAWRVFTKGIDRAAALQQIEIEGDRALGETVLGLTAIVA